MNNDEFSGVLHDLLTGLCVHGYDTAKENEEYHGAILKECVADAHKLATELVFSLTSAELEAAKAEIESYKALSLNIGDLNEENEILKAEIERLKKDAE